MRRAIGARGPAATIVRGRVVPGDQRGRTLGFPTANVCLTAADADIADGVWAAIAVVDGTARAATVSVGRRPTYYDEGERLLEAYVLDFSGDLYGREMSVRLGRYLRPQRRYDDEEALVAQMHRDVSATRRWALAERGVVALGRREDLAVERRRQKRMARQERLRDDIARAVGDLARDDLSHESVAARSRAPLGLVRWAFPTLADLRSARPRP